MQLVCTSPPLPPFWNNGKNTLHKSMNYLYSGDKAIMKDTARLNLFNHVLVLFHAKFACNSAIRYPVFRLELCKGYVWKSVKKLKCVCIRGFSRLDLANDSRLATCQMPHVWSMQEAERSRQLEHYKTKSTIWPNNYLAT